MIVSTSSCFLILLIIGTAATQTLPENLERCDIKRDGLEDCLKRSIENILKTFGTTGIPSLKLPPLEPLAVSKIFIPVGSNAIKVEQHFFDARLHGFSTAEIQSPQLDYDKRSFNFTSYIDELVQNAGYEINGNILLLPITGHGDSTVTLISVERCHVKSGGLDQCLKRSIQNILKTFATTGEPFLNVPPLEPLEISQIFLPVGSNAVKLEHRFFDVRLHGFSTATIESAHMDYDRKSFNFTSYMDKLLQNARYELNGSILLLPIRGNGNSTITLSGFKVLHIISFKERISNGKTYFDVETYKIKTSAKKIHFHYSNLFDGNKVLGDNINQVLNENWQAVFADIQGQIGDAYAEVYKNYANLIFSHVPVDDLFLM